jgi:hypothetical protein
LRIEVYARKKNGKKVGRKVMKSAVRMMVLLLIAAALTGCSFLQDVTDQIIAEIFVTQNDSYSSAYQDFVGNDDEEALKAINLMPAAGKKLYPNAPFFIYFDKLVDPNTVDGNVIVLVDKDPVSINVVLSTWYDPADPRAQLTVSPKNGWPTNSVLNVSIESGLKDVYGNSFNKEEFSYKTGVLSSTELTAGAFSFEDGDDSIFYIEGRGGLFSFSDDKVQEDVDFSALEGDKAVLLSTANGNNGDILLDWDGLAGNAIMTDMAAAKGLSAPTLSSRGIAAKDSGEEPPMDGEGEDSEQVAFGAGEYSTFSLNNVSIPAGASSLKLDYYFLSDEFMFYIGSIFDDVATYSLNDSNGNVKSNVIDSVNLYDGTKTSAENGLTLVPGFPSVEVWEGEEGGGEEGELSKNLEGGDEGEQEGVFRTDMETLTIPLGVLSGNVDLFIMISDVGDNILNSYIIFDNIRFE